MRAESSVVSCFVTQYHLLFTLKKTFDLLSWDTLTVKEPPKKSEFFSVTFKVQHTFPFSTFICDVRVRLKNQTTNEVIVIVY